jgi:hypothetical protein
MWGWVYDLEMNYTWLPVAGSHLREVLSESRGRGVFGAGKGDLHLRAPRLGVEFTLCHESGVHVVASDARVVEGFVTAWRSRRIGSCFVDA